MITSNNTDEPRRTLRNLDLPPVVDTARHDLETEFYEPCLSVTKRYDRGVGFFSTRWFGRAIRGVTSLVGNDGRARWIVSPIMSESDAHALEDGYDARSTDEQALISMLNPQIEDLAHGLAVDTRNTVGWLIAEDYIDIRVVIPTNGGMFHDKFGVFEDVDGNRLSFHGSKNDSEQAFRNYEAYTLDGDWRGEPDENTVDDHDNRFQRIWDGEVDGLRTVVLPDAIQAGLLQLRSTDVPPYRPMTSDGGTVGEAEEPGEEQPLRETVTLRPYQSDAVGAWVNNGYRGIFEMATGLGKTITAMASIDAYADTLDTGVIVVVAVPEKYLGRQWSRELTGWGFEEPVMAYRSANHAWPSDLSGLVTDVELGLMDVGIAITTHASFYKEQFRKHIDRAQVPCMLIADEVHGAGTVTRQAGLDHAYDARLGLSATPERYMDSEGTDALTEYFDDVVFEYGIAEGIPEYLSEYEYYPVVVELTPDEAAEYIDESRRLAATISSEKANDTDIRRVAEQRSNIAKTAENKVSALRNVFSVLPNHDGLLIFVHHEQLETVTEELNAVDIKYHQYTQNESTAEREQLLSAFARPEDGLDALVGINCLDEGVDVSSAQTAILMSSTGNPRQFVQRRGRVLRRDENKDVARIYDFIVVPPRDHFADLLDSERNLILKQLDRHEEFAQTARNATEARELVGELRAALQDE